MPQEAASRRCLKKDLKSGPLPWTYRGAVCTSIEIGSDAEVEPDMTVSMGLVQGAERIDDISGTIDGVQIAAAC